MGMILLFALEKVAQKAKRLYALPFVTDFLSFPLFLLCLNFANLTAATDSQVNHQFLLPQAFVAEVSATDSQEYHQFV